MTKEIDKTDARQGQTGNGVWKILIISTALAAGALILLWIFRG